MGASSFFSPLFTRKGIVLLLLVALVLSVIPIMSVITVVPQPAVLPRVLPYPIVLLPDRDGETVDAYAPYSSEELSLMASAVTAASSGHSNPAHNPNIGGSWANQQVWWLIASWTGLLAQPNGPRCGKWVEGDHVKRWVYWVAREDFPLGKGLLVWGFVKAGGILGDFGGAYPAAQSQMSTVVQSLADRGWKYVSIPCRDAPNPGLFRLPPGPPTP